MLIFSVGLSLFAALGQIIYGRSFQNEKIRSAPLGGAPTRSAPSGGSRFCSFLGEVGSWGRWVPGEVGSWGRWVPGEVGSWGGGLPLSSLQSV